jgi:hypothetical protein
MGENDQYVEGQPVTIRMADGTVHTLFDWLNESLRSAFVIEPGRKEERFDLFTYARSQSPAALAGAYAMRAHTNLLRSGEVGLPKMHEMLVDSWRATAGTVLHQKVIDFASETTCIMHYNGKEYRQDTLIDLLLGSKRIADTRMISAHEYLKKYNKGMLTAENGDQPVPELLAVHIRENLPFGVRVVCESSSALAAYRAYLGKHDERATFWVHLEGPYKRIVV